MLGCRRQVNSYAAPDAVLLHRSWELGTTGKVATRCCCPAASPVHFILRPTPKPSTIEVGNFERRDCSTRQPAVGSRYIFTLRLTPKPSSIEVMFCEGSTVEVGIEERIGRPCRAAGAVHSHVALDAFFLHRS